MAAAQRTKTNRRLAGKVASLTASSSAWAQQLGDNELLCRDLGHTWMPHTVAWDQRVRSYKQALRCPRCTTIRTRLISRTGEILASHYTYPARYLAPSGIGRMDAGVRGTLRVASITRIINAAQEAATKTAALSTNVVDINNGKTK